MAVMVERLLFKAAGASAKKESRSPKARTHHDDRGAVGKGKLLDYIAKGGAAEAVSQTGEDGTVVVRMKIVIRKEELNQVLRGIKQQQQELSSSSMNSSSPSPAVPTTLTLEQRLILLRKKVSAGRAVRQARCSRKAGGASSWTPVLHSIPEERY